MQTSIKITLAQIKELEQTGTDELTIWLKKSEKKLHNLDRTLQRQESKDGGGDVLRTKLWQRHHHRELMVKHMRRILDERHNPGRAMQPPQELKFRAAET